MISRKLAAAVLASTCLAATGGAATAQELTLRLADSFPTTHVLSKEGAQFFIDRVEELSGGSIAVEYFPASQLGKAADFLTLVQSGTVDMAYIPPAYVQAKMPLSDVANLPGMFSDVCAGSEAYIELAREGLVKETDYDAQGVRLVFGTMLAPYQISGPNVPIKSLADLQGKKIRSTGSATNLVVEALGGVPVNLSGAETYDGLERGTIDFNLGPYSSYKGYDLYDQTNYGTVGFGFGNTVVGYTMNASVYDGLSDELKAFIDQAGKDTSAHVCAAVEKENDNAIAEMRELGAEFFEATPETLKEFEPIALKLQEQWAADKDAKGLPGTETLEAMRTALTD